MNTILALTTFHFALIVIVGGIILIIGSFPRTKDKQADVLAALLVRWMGVFAIIGALAGLSSKTNMQLVLGHCRGIVAGIAFSWCINRYLKRKSLIKVQAVTSGD
jgi:hypothetical protein